ncbi:hypothetical protein F511_36115 [Dorcoceras hygrometricum]|uniref:Uncharacterized protein n=1 Tax=Dorcoceras hygrometricum TaxID=472368 RepID=A0A2Z7CQS1_9LAMI|nr:hypothetical protein F511_36115 [Dorcoceras hygrometricum]
MNSWTQSSISLDKLCEIQKPANDGTGLGFNTSESSFGETCTQSNLAHDKLKKMSFVKASVIHDPCESVRYDDQILELLNKKGKARIGYDRPKSSKSGWLKNRLDKEKAKAGSKSFVKNQQRRGSKKVKSEWRKVEQLLVLSNLSLLFMGNIVEFRFDKISDLGDLSFRGNERSELISAESTEYVDESPAATTAKDIDLATVTDVGQSSSDEELLSIDDLRKRIPGDMMLPSVLAGEPTGIKFGRAISIPGVADGDLYKASLPKIALNDKGKESLVEVNIVKVHPARDMVDLIFGDIEFLIQLREHVIDEVSAFFNSFSLRRLAFLTSLNKYIAAKEEDVLTWAKADSVQVALQRKIIDLLSDAHSTSVKDLLMQRQAHGLQWTRPCCSMLFEDAFDRGFYIPRNHNIFVSTYWLRLLIRIGDVWVVEDGYDRWVHKDETPVSQLLVQLHQWTSLESLAPICLLSQPVQCLSAYTSLPVKTWGWYRVCTEILQYSMFGCLRPVGSFTVCTDIVPTGPVLGDFSIPRRVVDNVSYRIQILDSALPDFQCTDLARIEIQIQMSALSLDILASQRKLITQQAAIATGLDDIRKDVDETKVSNAILDFHAQAQENYNNISSQLGELVAYINRVMTKRGKRVATADLNRLLMIRIDPVGVLRVEEVVLVKVAEEMIEGVLNEKGIR